MEGCKCCGGWVTCDTTVPCREGATDMRDLIMALMLVLPISGAAQELNRKDFEYDDIERMFLAGKCDHATVPVAHRRTIALVFIQDVILGVVGQQSLSKDLWGDFDIFRIGRTPDNTLVVLYDYASRADVTQQIYKDADAISEATKRADLSVIDATAIICDLYKMSNGMDFTFKPELQTYFQTLNRKIRNKNLENLQNLLE